MGEVKRHTIEDVELVLATDYDLLREEATHLRREIAELRGDLSIARLQRDAKLCSKCPRTPELEQLREKLEVSYGLLREARKWMRHEDKCKRMIPCHSFVESTHQPCTCGLDDFLKGLAP